MNREEYHDKIHLKHFLALFISGAELKYACNGKHFANNLQKHVLCII